MKMDPYAEAFALFVLIAVFLVLLCVVLVISKFSSMHVDEKSSFEVFKLVESLRQICPAGSSKGWTLVSSYTGVSRCWQQTLQFPFIGENVPVIGSSVIIKTPSLTVLNIIADVKKWPEWRPVPKNQKLHIKDFSNACLQQDVFMHCDQVMSVSGKTDPVVLIYRFGFLQKNNVGWILLWHIRKLEWYFYLAQPMDVEGKNHDQCLLTAVHKPKYDHSKEISSASLISMLCAIKDAAEMSSIMYQPMYSMFDSSSNISDLHHSYSSTSQDTAADVPSDIFLKTSETCNCTFEFNKPSHVLVLAPIIHQGPTCIRRLWGFGLQCHELRISNNEESPQEDENLNAQRKKSFCLELDNHKTSSPKVPRSSTIASFGSDIYNQISSSTNSYSNSIKSHFSNILKRSIYKTDSDNSLVFSEDHFSDWDEPECKTNDFNQKVEHHLLHSDDTDDEFEFLTPSNPTYIGKEADIKTLGNYSASELQAEVIKASGVPLDEVLDNHPNKRGWVFHGKYRDIPLFFKQSIFKEFSSVSYLSKVEIPVHCVTAWNVLRNPFAKFMYDDSLKKIDVLKEFPEGQKILHTYHEVTPLLKRKEAVDFCLLHTERHEGSQYLVTVHSIEYEGCPLLPNVTRGMILSSGWVVEEVPEKNNCCLITHLVQIILGSPENHVLWDTNNNIAQFLLNLKEYLLSSPS